MFCHGILTKHTQAKLMFQTLIILTDFFLKIFIYLTDVGPDDGCMSYVQGSHKIGYAIRKAIYEKNSLPAILGIKDFKQIITVNKKYFDNYFEGTNVIDSFLTKRKILKKMAIKKIMVMRQKLGVL